MSREKFIETHFHDYAKPSGATENAEQCVVTPSQIQPCEWEAIDPLVLDDMKKKVDMFLFCNWTSILEKDGITLMMLSRDRPRVTQRSVFIRYDSSVEVCVHCVKIDSDSFVASAPQFLPLSGSTVGNFVDRAVHIVGQVRLKEICGGVDDDKYESVWGTCLGGSIDTNPYRETRYVETFRSTKCIRVVNSRVWRCSACTKLLRPLRRRLSSASHVWKKCTANVNLTEEQKLEKLEAQRREIDSCKKKIKRLHAKVQDLIKKEGVPLDKDLCSGLTEILKSKEISSAQEVFLHQQVKAANLKKKCGMRWHPTMIRFALSIYLTSRSAYEQMRDTGMIQLPHSRTLFDYAHVKPIEEGVDHYVLESVSKKVKAMADTHKRNHVLMADEMYISKNLVFQKSSGRMIGYTKLDEVDKEVRALNEFLDDPDKKFKDPPLEEATRVLCYMIKGISNGIKEVVACYAVKNVSVYQMYLWTWHVIGFLERCGVRVVVFVCDGSTTNRAFINLHKPVTILKSGVVIDTINKAAPSRVLFFMSDVSHLIKTVRNCFYKSRANGKGKRCMKRNGKKIVWDYIFRLYKDTRNKSLRKSYKLSPVNVYPDSYSCMKVAYAAQVLSLTVAADLKKKNYRGVSETVRFITEVNNWFDKLNGAHSSMGRKKKNPNLNPYTSVNDERFDELRDFLNYLDEWKTEAYSGNVTLNSTVHDDFLNDSALSEAAEVTFDPVENNDNNEEDTTPAGQKILSHQTLVGIEMTTQAFILCVPYLLRDGTHFINARVFSQDPLEQHFSKLRMGGGGSTNPNLARVLLKNRAVHIKSHLGMRRSRGNAREGEEDIKVTEEPLEKKKCVRTLQDFLAHG